VKVHVICHGLFGVVIPEKKDFVEAVFLDAAGWKDPTEHDHNGMHQSLHIPQHDLYIRYTAANGEIETLIQQWPTSLAIQGLPDAATKISSQPVAMNDVLGAANAFSLSQGCAPKTNGTGCLLNQEPLVTARLALSGGEMQNCEFDLANGIDFSAQPNGWGHQEFDYRWATTGNSQLVQKTFNAVCFTFETDSAQLLVNGVELELGLADKSIQRRLRQLGTDFALILLNNTVSKQSLDGKFHIEPDRDTHSLLFHDLLENPLPIAARPIPELVLPVGPRREAPPLNRCIPYSYNI